MHERAKSAVHIFFKSTVAVNALKVQFMQVYLVRRLYFKIDKRNIKRMTNHMNVKRNQFSKFRRQFNLRIAHIVKNVDHRYSDLVGRWTETLSSRADAYFTVIFNILLRGYLLQSLSFILTNTGDSTKKELTSLGRITVIESLGDISSGDSILNQIEMLIKKKDPVFMANNTIKVRKAFFGTMIGSQAKYKLENIKTLAKIEQSISKLDYCRLVTRIISKFTDKTGQDIQGLDDLKLEEVSDGKLKVPSLRKLVKTMGAKMNREELESMNAMKKIKSMNNVADLMKQKRRFNINLRGDFVNMLIVEMAKHLEHLDSSPRNSVY